MEEKERKRLAGIRAYHWERVANYTAAATGKRPPFRCRTPSRDKALWHMTTANALTDQLGDGHHFTEAEFKRWRQGRV